VGLGVLFDHHEETGGACTLMLRGCKFVVGWWVSH
jgi:hypothetical protein